MKPEMSVPIDPLLPPQIGHAGYQGFNPRVETLCKGDAPFNARVLPCDILVEHDVTITMRDGIKLYADIYRPPATSSSEKCPAILSWSPFGKKFNELDWLRLFTPWSLGIPRDSLSGLEKFEGLDPAEWVQQGYAIINIDSRGAFDSEGCMVIMGTQEAEDGYDAIEDIARREWCNGSVGMAGNSQLAIIQCFIAALQPPSLKAIAPLEGCGDLYREQFCRGGMYGGSLFDQLIVRHMLRGRHGMESFRLAHEQRPLMNKWWADKRPDTRKIKIPAYITGTWTNSMHGMGAIRGWMESSTSKANKWLRFHAYQEWYDRWGCGQAKAELLQYFNRYLKGEQNVLRYETKPALQNLVVEDFPIPQTQYKNAYLSSEGELSLSLPGQVGSATYDSQQRSAFVSFTYKFPQTTKLVGIPKAVLYMSCSATDDMDIYVILCKLSATGQEQMSLNIPFDGIPVSTIHEIPKEKRTEMILYKGPTGMLRASRRSDKIAPGTIVRVEIGIWAMGIEYEAGESIQVQISGQFRGMGDFKSTVPGVNKGTHLVHFGGQYDSHVVLPFVP
ncbi:Alpha/Beta hydrolase protein [Aspergillus heterothallicus]